MGTGWGLRTFPPLAPSWENHSSYRSVQTGTGTINLRPKKRRTEPRLPRGRSPSPARASVDADTPLPSAAAVWVPEHPGKAALEITQRLFRVLMWGNHLWWDARGERWVTGPCQDGTKPKGLLKPQPGAQKGEKGRGKGREGKTPAPDKQLLT